MAHERRHIAFIGHIHRSTPLGSQLQR